MFRFFGFHLLFGLAINYIYTQLVNIEINTKDWYICVGATLFAYIYGLIIGNSYEEKNG